MIPSLLVFASPCNTGKPEESQWQRQHPNTLATHIMTGSLAALFVNAWLVKWSKLSSTHLYAPLPTTTYSCTMREESEWSAQHCDEMTHCTSSEHVRWRRDVASFRHHGCMWLAHLNRKTPSRFQAKGNFTTMSRHDRWMWGKSLLSTPSAYDL